MEILKAGTKRYFVGSTEIPKPINHGYPPYIYQILLEQSGHVTKEWDGKHWVEIPNS